MTSPAEKWLISSLDHLNVLFSSLENRFLRFASVSRSNVRVMNTREMCPSKCLFRLFASEISCLQTASALLECWLVHLSASSWSRISTQGFPAAILYRQYTGDWVSPSAFPYCSDVVEGGSWAKFKARSRVPFSLSLLTIS